MRRPLAEARRDFEQFIAPRLNEHQLREVRQRLEAAEGRARQRAAEYVVQREQEALALRDESLRELTEVRDEYDRLAITAPDGRTSARDLGAQLAELQRRQAAAEERLSRAEAVAERIAEVEEDPIAWFDSITAGKPTLMEDLW